MMSGYYEDANGYDKKSVFMDILVYVDFLVLVGSSESVNCVAILQMYSNIESQLIWCSVFKWNYIAEARHTCQEWSLEMGTYSLVTFHFRLAQICVLLLIFKALGIYILFSYIWGLVCQMQVSRAGTSNFIPQILWRNHLALSLIPAWVTHVFISLWYRKPQNTNIEVQCHMKWT